MKWTPCDPVQVLVFVKAVRASGCATQHWATRIVLLFRDSAAPCIVPAEMEPTASTISLKLIARTHTHQGRFGFFSVVFLTLVRQRP